MRFIASTGYLPVTQDAFENRMGPEIEQVEDARIKKMLVAVTEMYENYDFFVAPTFEAFDALGGAYEKDFKAFLAQQREAWLKTEGGSLDEQSAAALKQWKQQ